MLMEPVSYQGVSNQRDGTYSTNIVLSGGKPHLVEYKSSSDAARADDVAALACLQTSAVTNFPKEAYGFAEGERAKGELNLRASEQNKDPVQQPQPASIPDGPAAQDTHMQDSTPASAATPNTTTAPSAVEGANSQQETVHPSASNSMKTAGSGVPDSCDDKLLISAADLLQQLGTRTAVATGVPNTAGDIFFKSETAVALVAAVSPLSAAQQQHDLRRTSPVGVPAASADAVVEPSKDQQPQQQQIQASKQQDEKGAMVPASPADTGLCAAAQASRDQQQEQQPPPKDQQQEEASSMLGRTDSSELAAADSGAAGRAAATVAQAGETPSELAKRTSQWPTSSTADLLQQQQQHLMSSSSSMGSDGMVMNAVDEKVLQRAPSRRKPSSSSSTGGSRQEQQQQQQQQTSEPALRRGNARAAAAAATVDLAVAAAAVGSNTGPGAAGTGYRGIILRRNGRYDGRLTVLGVKLYLGVFENPADAAAAYDLAALALYEHNAATNFPRSNYSGSVVAARRYELLSKLMNHQNVEGSQAGQQAREWALAQMARDMRRQQQQRQRREAADGAQHNTALGRVGPAAAAAATAAVRDSKAQLGQSSAAAVTGKRAAAGSSNGIDKHTAVGKKPRLAAAAAAAGDLQRQCSSNGRGRPRQQQQHKARRSAPTAAASSSLDDLWGEYALHNDVLDGLFCLIEAAACLSSDADPAAAAAAGPKFPAAGMTADTRCIAHGGQKQQRQQHLGTPGKPLAALMKVLSPAAAAAASAAHPAAARSDSAYPQDRDTLAEALMAGPAERGVKKDAAAAAAAACNTLAGKVASTADGIADVMCEQDVDMSPADSDAADVAEQFVFDHAEMDDPVWDSVIVAAAAAADDGGSPDPAAAADNTILPAAATDLQQRGRGSKRQSVAATPSPTAAAAKQEYKDQLRPDKQATATPDATRAATEAAGTPKQIVEASFPQSAGKRAAPAAAPAARVAAADKVEATKQRPTKRARHSITPEPGAAANAAAAAVSKEQRLLRSQSGGSSAGRSSRSSSTTPVPVEVAAAAKTATATAAPVADKKGAVVSSGKKENIKPKQKQQHKQQKSKQQQDKQQHKGKVQQQRQQQENEKASTGRGRHGRSRLANGPLADTKTATVAAAAAKATATAKGTGSGINSSSTRKPAVTDRASPAAEPAARDGPAAAAIERRSSRESSVLNKTSGPGSVSHAQNPTGFMGVRSRKGKYEAFVATPPFRYLYLGQYETVDAAVLARDSAMVVLYGSTAADHGAAWCSPGAADAAAVAGSTAAAAAADMAVRLYKKENVPAVMKEHGTEHLLELGRKRQQQQQQAKKQGPGAGGAAAQVHVQQ